MIERNSDAAAGPIWSAVVLVMVTGLSACADGQPSTQGVEASARAATLARIEGIYEMTAYSENLASCDGEGASKLADRSERMFVIAASPGNQFAVAQLKTCRTMEECSARLQNEMASAEEILPFAAIVDDRLTGPWVTTGFSRDGACKDALSGKLSAVADGDGVKVERRGVRHDYAADSRGMCSTDVARDRADGKPCNDLMTIRGKRVASLKGDAAQE